MNAIMRIQTVSDLLEAANIAHDAFERKEIWFRGEPGIRTRDVDWKLIPKIYRADEKTGDKPRYLSIAEQNIYKAFRRQAVARRADCPAQDEIAQWLALMQHHGLPTRLLDWTQSILVAAYFAVTHQGEHDAGDPQPGVIWGLDAYTLSKRQLGPPVLIAELTNSLVKDAFGLGVTAEAAKLEILPVVCAQVHLRMMLQQGTSTLHRVNTPLDEIQGHGCFLRRFEIPAAAKIGIRAHLRRLGIREATLFPELEHLANDLADDTPPS